MDQSSVVPAQSPYGATDRRPGTTRSLPLTPAPTPLLRGQIRPRHPMPERQCLGNMRHNAALAPRVATRADAQHPGVAPWRQPQFAPSLAPRARTPRPPPRHRGCRPRHCWPGHSRHSVPAGPPARVPPVPPPRHSARRAAPAPVRPPTPAAPPR
jgi:hypothetical protein